MKKILLSLFIILALFSTTVFAWDDCPYDHINEPYPGKCGLYSDTNSDHICDLSQHEPQNTVTSILETETDDHDLISGEELKTKTIIEVAQIYEIGTYDYTKALADYYDITIKQTDSFQDLHDKGVAPSVAKDIALSLKNGDTIKSNLNNSTPEKRVYHLIPISVVILLFFILTKVLSKRKVIRLANHRMIWNIALLITFLISGILGVLLILRVNFRWFLTMPFNMLYWHVEVGIAMFIISVIHIIERWVYFKHIFTSKTK